MGELEPCFVEDFKFLHQHPEKSFEEFETTKFIQERLLSLGIEIMEHDMETGVVGLLRGASDGPCIALRADIDALPIEEQSSCTFPSQNKGFMHACGHDSHAASLLAAARLLAACRDTLHGSVKFLFQPAEEINFGAKKMMAHRVLENPTVSAVFGLHNSPEIPVGTVVVKKGPLMAAVNRINMKITGRGGHGGIPQRNDDPIVCAASIILSAQTIVSRNLSPFDPCVLSICNVRAGEGTTNNVTPNEVVMYGTVRAFHSENIDLIETRLRQIIASTCAAYNCTGELEFIRELGVTGAETLYDTALAAVRGAGVEPVDATPSTGGEDFSEYQKGSAPCFFYWLGTRNEAQDCVYSWHSPHFKIDPHCIAIGGGVYAMSVFQMLEDLRKEK
ncbi:MAG: M20 family metallopeptidase [Oscillospiraceae bacterium]